MVKPKSRWLQTSELRGITPLPSGDSSTDENASGPGTADNPTHFKKSILSKIENSSDAPSSTAVGATPAEKSSLSHLNQDVFQVAEEDDKENVTQPAANTSPAAQPEAKTLFEKIDELEYLFEKKKVKSRKEVKRMICDCSPPTSEEMEDGEVGCGDECLNRLLMIECGSRCPCGDACTNKRFQRRKYADVAAKATPGKGHGLFTHVDLVQGDFIMEYVGEVLGPHDFKQRVKQYAREGQKHHYFMSLRTDEIIDATRKGNESRFYNHSCEPNCETQKWTVNGELRVGFFVKKFVPAGSELTFDYQFETYGKNAQKCYCGAPTCRGYIGGSKEKRVQREGGEEEDEEDDEEEDSADADSAREDDGAKGAASKAERRKRRRLAAAEKEDAERDAKFLEKMKRELEDLSFEDEIDRMPSQTGLKSRNQVLHLSRLMVRAETSSQRSMLLKVLRGELLLAFS